LNTYQKLPQDLRDAFDTFKPVEMYIGSRLDEFNTGPHMLFVRDYSFHIIDEYSLISTVSLFYNVKLINTNDPEPILGIGSFNTSSYDLYTRQLFNSGLLYHALVIENFEGLKEYVKLMDTN